ncbi:MAG: peptidylprolyl isomerase [Bacteroidales bacterium]|nr:peptidylprolyl isomerase [Bacteroidales bacterium]
MFLRRFSAVAAAILVLSLSAAKAQVYKNGLIDKTVALIGNESILLSQIEEQVQLLIANGGAITDEKKMRCNILEQTLQQKLFLNQAKLDSLQVSSDMVEVELQERVDGVLYRLGGQTQVEAYFRKPLFRLKEDWRAVLSDQNLIQQEQRQIITGLTTLTPSEVRRFYKKVDKDTLPIISTQYRISHIVLYPSKEDAIMEVKEKLLEFRQRVINGERFSSLAALYSDDKETAMRGGELGMAPKAMFWPAFSDAAVSLKEGQISQIVETPDGYHLIQMIEKNGDMFNARHILLKPKYTDAERTKCMVRLDSIRNAILIDSTTFEKAARMFSQDPKSYLNGGQMVDENTGSTFFEKDMLKPSDYAVLKDMKIGDISAPFESQDNEGKGQTIFKIIRLEEIIPSHTADVDKDFVVIQNFAQGIRQQQAIKDFIEEKQKTTFIRIDEMFRDCPFESKGWVKENK